MFPNMLLKYYNSQTCLQGSVTGKVASVDRWPLFEASETTYQEFHGTN